ncbi:MAG: D-tyrosyl-tRNA(Tyr) deacylase [Clostridia bacterium]|nr:D-tyrosyl-tRNA(Tyr) deacylase [Clostridia bacterium]
MRSVVQRVKSAQVQIDGEVVGKISGGLLVLLGVCDEDTEQDVTWLADKIAGLRIFTDENDKMNLSLEDVGGGVLVVSQFTLYGNCKKGRRPNFSAAGKPDFAEKMYNKFTEYLRGRIKTVETGRFGADMLVSLENDGPVTLILDSKE